MLKVEKGWGHELIWADHEKYCGKFLKFNKGAKFSMHFHAEKDETWYVLEGKFTLLTIDTENSDINEITLEKGEIWHNPPLLPHQLICVEEGTIIEVSTKDEHKDNYRIYPGDSQK